MHMLFIRNPFKASPTVYKEQQRNQKAAEMITVKHEVRICCVNSSCNAQNSLSAVIHFQIPF